MIILLCRKTVTTAIQRKGVGEEVYENPDKIAATTPPGKFKLVDCPAYVATSNTDKL